MLKHMRRTLVTTQFTVDNVFPAKHSLASHLLLSQLQTVP